MASHFYQAVFKFISTQILTQKMTVVVCLLLATTPLFSQSILDGRIDFTAKKMTVEDALLQLSEVADIGILFPADLFSESQIVSLKVKNETVENILKQCLSQTNITFKLENGNLILSVRPPRKLTVSGFVEDAESGERLIAATVLDLKSGKGTTTNEYGFFSLQILEGDCQFQISYIGYQTDNQLFSLKKSTKFIFQLNPALTLSEIIVTPDKTAKNSQHFLLGKGLEVTPQDLNNVPALAGEADLFRYLQLQSGVQSGADGLGGLHVRGGATDQNLVLLDGVPIYNPSHTLGLFSIFNSPTIKTAKLQKNGFSARYGGRLSSVIDVRTKEGNIREFSSSLGISTLATNVFVEGPIVKNKIGFLLSARRSHIDPLLVSFSRKEKRKLSDDFGTTYGGEADYHFYDINAKLHFNLSSTDRVFLSFYQGGDRLDDDNKYDVDIGDYYYQDRIIFTDEDRSQKLAWGNQISALRWNHLFGEKLFSNTTFTFSQFEYKSENFVSLYDEFYGMIEKDYSQYTRFQSVMQDASVKLDFDYFPNNNHHLTFGGGFLYRNFKPALIEINDSIFVDIDYFDEIDEIDDFNQIDEFVNETFAPVSSTAKEFELYVEDKFLLRPNLAISAGVHAALFQTDEVSYPSIQPRLNILWTPIEKLQLSLSGSRMTQFLHILTSSNNGFPNDSWLPSNKQLKPENAWQISLESTLTLNDNWQTKLGSYYKLMDNLLAYQDGSELPNLLELDPFFLEELITTGDGRSYGVEYELHKKQGKTTGTFAYNWIKTFRKFRGINGNREFPFRNHHEHSFSLHLNHQFNEIFSANALFEFGSGQQITLIETFEEFTSFSNQEAFENRLSSYNGYKLPVYHRLDLNLRANFGKKALKHQITLGVYNLYNRKNPYFVYQINDDFFPENNGLREKSVLPILPTIGYQLRWN